MSSDSHEGNRVRLGLCRATIPLLQKLRGDWAWCIEGLSLTGRSDSTMVINEVGYAISSDLRFVQMGVAVVVPVDDGLPNLTVRFGGLSHIVTGGVEDRIELMDGDNSIWIEQNLSKAAIPFWEAHSTPSALISKLRSDDPSCWGTYDRQMRAVSLGALLTTYENIDVALSFLRTELDAHRGEIPKKIRLIERLYGILEHKR